MTNNISFQHRKMARNHLLLVFGVFFLLSTAKCSLFPKDHEITYDYQAVVSTSTQYPTLYSSEFLIRASISVFGHDNSATVSLKNVVHSLYSGIGKGVGVETGVVPIPEESKSIEKPFVINYENNGLVSNIMTEDDDELWSVNMKRSIASALQLDLKNIVVEANSNSSHGFYTEEASVYGKCKVLYSVLKIGDSVFTVKKHMKPTSCKGFQWNAHFSSSPSHCGTSFENPLTITSEKHYDVESTKDGLLINDIGTINDIALTPFRGNSDIYSVTINQNFHKMDMKKVPQDKRTDKKNMHLHDIIPQLVTHDTFKGAIYDVTGGRAKYNSDSITGRVKDTLKNVVNQLENVRTDFANSMNTKGGTIHYLFYQLRLLDEAQLESCYSTLKNTVDSTDEELLPLFLQTLPHLGTRASSLFIKNLIVNKRIEDDVAITLLKRLPFYIKYPNLDLVKKLSVLTEENTDITENVRNTATIALATIISKTVKSESDNEELQTYVDKYIDKYVTSTDTSVRSLYINVLYNLKFPKVVKCLEFVIKGGKNDSPHLRSRAVWALKSEYKKHPDHFDKILWPIVENKTEDLEIRYASMSVLMTNPSLTNLLRMHQFMQTKVDDELYKSYYSLLKSLSESKLPCNKEVALNYKRILRLSHKHPRRSTRGLELAFDFFDEKYGFGAGVKASLFNDATDKRYKYTSLYMQYSSHVANMNMNLDAVSLFAFANEDIYYTEGHIEDTINYYGWAWRSVMLSYMDVEVILYHGDWVTYHEIVNRKVLPDGSYFMFSDWLNLRSKEHMSREPRYDLSQYANGEVIIPTDLGVPIVAFIQMPSINKMKKYFIDNRNMNLDINNAQMSNHVFGLVVYNPVVNAWHGVRKIHVYNTYLPFKLDTPRSPLGLLNFTGEHGTIEEFGFQFYSYSNVFIQKVDEKLLRAVCKDCNSNEVVSLGNSNKKQRVLFENYLDVNKILGISHTVEFFNCEEDISDDKLEKLLHGTFSTQNKNVGGFPFMKYLLGLKYMLGYMTVSPMYNICGLRFKLKPDHTHIKIGSSPVTDDRTTRLLGDINPAESESKRIITYTMFNGDQLSNWWVFVLNRESNKYLFVQHKKGTDEYLKVCAQSNFTEEQLRTTMEIVVNAGYTEESDKCPYDEAFVKFTMNRTLKDRKSSNLFDEIVESCDEKEGLFMCMTNLMYLQEFEYELYYENLPKITEYQDLFLKNIATFYDKYSVPIVSKNVEEESQLKASLLYYSPYKFDLDISTHSNNLLYQNIPINDTNFSTYLFNLNSLIMYNIVLCTWRRTPDVGKNWTEYANGTCHNGECIWKMYMKSSNLRGDADAIAFVTPDNRLEVYGEQTDSSKDRLLTMRLKSLYNRENDVPKMLWNGKELVGDEAMVHKGSDLEFIYYKRMSHLVVHFKRDNSLVNIGYSGNSFYVSLPTIYSRKYYLC